MHTRLVATLAFALSTSGCAIKGGALRGIEARTDAAAVTRICGVLVDVAIEDERDAVSDRPIQIPRVTTAREFDAIRPPLEGELQDIIRSEVARRFSGDGPDVSAQVRVLNGVQRFRARALSEVETAQWNTEIVLSTGARTTSGLGQAEHSVRSLDASRSFSDTLSRRVLRLSVAEAFTQAAAPLIDSSDPMCSAAEPVRAGEGLRER